MADKMRRLRWEYDVVRGAIVTRMWECFYRIKDECENQRKERVKKEHRK